jgi:membrane-associated phospholipid phosphatase
MVDVIIRILADGLMLPIVLIGAYALLVYVPNNQKIKSYPRIIMAGITALLLAKLTGLMWQPDSARPFIEMGVQAKAAYLDNAGFPSDHVLFAAAISFAVWFETKRPKVAILLFVLTVLVALGRVLALVHTPLDCFGGFIFASFGALWYLTKTSKTTKKNSTRG